MLKKVYYRIAKLSGISLVYLVLLAVCAVPVTAGGELEHGTWACVSDSYLKEVEWDHFIGIVSDHYFNAEGQEKYVLTRPGDGVSKEYNACDVIPLLDSGVKAVFPLQSERLTPCVQKTCLGIVTAVNEETCTCDIFVTWSGGACTGETLDGIPISELKKCIVHPAGRRMLSEGYLL
ncbi:hypothetical protein FTO70_09265 [Methanosarcina sp. KYL-1]|uniref:hypothetical protein n=1 Tax=Methanosarcina sp. KYL-1 TaxID=2602068 RepID=UPI002100C950|nr:hypothetical protein [Methanosarcina sp. KYL-1]MCQ1535863.1 hypothetical protein [Methanosarcina sp. KYL-1]